MKIQQRLKKRSRSRAQMCDCQAYPFGHRMGGGKCNRNQSQGITTVSYHHSRQAWIDAGVSEKDFA